MLGWAAVVKLGSAVVPVSLEERAGSVADTPAAATAADGPSGVVEDAAAAAGAEDLAGAAPRTDEGTGGRAAG